MDCFARGLRNAAKLISDGVIPKMVAARYATFDKEALGKKIESGEATLEECEQYAAANEPLPKSGKQELYEMILNRYC